MLDVIDDFKYKLSKAEKDEDIAYYKNAISHATKKYMAYIITKDF